MTKSHLHVALCRASDKEVLVGIQRQGFDGRVMGLESVEQLPLADVKHAHKALSASSDQQLLFRSVLQHSGPILMAGECWRGRRRRGNCGTGSHETACKEGQLVKRRISYHGPWCYWMELAYPTDKHSCGRKKSMSLADVFCRWKWRTKKRLMSSLLQILTCCHWTVQLWRWGWRTWWRQSPRRFWSGTASSVRRNATCYISLECMFKCVHLCSRGDREDDLTR